MTDRAKFEGEISAPPYEKSVSRWANDPAKHGWPGGYKDIAVDLAWCMWQASRKQMAEEAAAVCDRSARGWGGPMPCLDCADAIRSLATPTEGKT